MATHQHPFDWSRADTPTPPITPMSVPPTAFTAQYPHVKGTKSTRDALNVNEQHWPPEHLQPEALSSQNAERLTLYQRWFTRKLCSRSSDPEKPSGHHFSFFSIGFLVVAVTMLVTSATLCAVLVTVLAKEDIEHHPSPIRSAIMANFPDPAITTSNNTWYAFATNPAAGILNRPTSATVHEYDMPNIQLATSGNFVNWTLFDYQHDPLPRLGDWVVGGKRPMNPNVPRANVWAPDVLQRPSDGQWIMYYSAQADNFTHVNRTERKLIASHCVGAAVSLTDSPAGPYEAENSTLACPLPLGGAIDPAGFIDKDNMVYVAYKVDGNNIGYGGSCGNTVAPIQSTPIMLQKMLPDAITTDGEPVVLLDRDESDGPLIEAPVIVRSHEGIYFLFFSSGCTRAPSYDLKYATAPHISGPYTRAQYSLLKTGDWGLTSPGSVGIHDNGNGGWNMALHARVTLDYSRVRAMFTTKLLFNGNMVSMVR